MQALWMVLAAFLFASMGVCVKVASEYFNSAELVCYRGLIGMLILWLLARSQRGTLGTQYPRIHDWRSPGGGGLFVGTGPPAAGHGDGAELPEQRVDRGLSDRRHVAGLAPLGSRSAPD